MSKEELLKNIELDVERDRRTLSIQSEEDKVRARTMSNANRGRTVSDAIKSAERYKRMEEHRMPLTTLYNTLKTSEEKGLTNEEALKRNKIHGDNLLSVKHKTPWYCLLAKEMIASFSLLLWIGAILCFIVFFLDTTQTSNLWLGLALVFVIIFSGVQNYMQNAKSDALMESFKNFIPPKAKVRRGGEWQTCDAIKLVPGDIIEVKAGDRIPADIRIIFSQEMKVDNSSLTGESDPLLRTVECTNQHEPLETANLAFFGTLCPEGLGRGVVIMIGDKTVIGQIAGLASAAGTVETPLRREMNRFVKIIAVIAFGTGFSFFGLGFIIGYPAITNLVFGIGILCAYVPEGLVTCVVVALTITATRLAAKKVLVKNLESVETLGSASCICSDKTGTLTQNRMTVENVWYDGTIKKATNKQKIPAGQKPAYDLDSPGFRDLQENAVLCSDAVFDNAIPAARLQKLDKITDENERERQRQIIEDEYKKELQSKLWLDRPVVGDASETALVKFFQAIDDILVRRSNNAIRKINDGTIAKIPFNSAWKYALVICEKKTEDSDNCIYIKGAPERIWGLSEYVNLNGKPVRKDDTWEKKFEEANKEFGNGGQRVLGFAKLHLPRNEYPANFQFNCKNAFDPNYPMKGFVFTGLVSLIDPPREAVPFAILKCKTAGIKVIMVTGDQPATAAAIARQVNIFEKNEITVNQVAEKYNLTIDQAFDRADAIVIHGDMITEASKFDEKCPASEKGKIVQKWLTKPRIVFARTTPAQKLIIVKACQAQGHVVAVTGDGVNDSPAIKKADIGIAMGITGSDVAKDAADMVLLTDDFAAIVLGIEEGRKIYDNLKRAIIYCLAANIAELFPFLGFFILGLPLPLSSILILCIDLGYNIFPAISFASEEAELDIMVRPPRTKNDHLVTSRLITSAYLTNGVFESFGGYLVYYCIMNDFGFSLSSLNGMANNLGFAPLDSNTVYDPNAPFFGHDNPNFWNYCLGCQNGTNGCTITSSTKKDAANDIDNLSGVPDWIYNSNATVDLRLFYLQCQKNTTGDLPIVYQPIDFSNCNVKQLSTTTGTPFPICYTADSLKFAQTGFYVSVALTQIFLICVVKTRRQSIGTSSLGNFSMIFGFASIVIVVTTISYFEALHSGFNSRPLILEHFGFPAIPFGLFMFVYDEIKKFLVRTLKPPDDKPTNWFERNTVW